MFSNTGSTWSWSTCWLGSILTSQFIYFTNWLVSVLFSAVFRFYSQSLQKNLTMRSHNSMHNQKNRAHYAGVCIFSKREHVHHNKCTFRCKICAFIGISFKRYCIATWPGQWCKTWRETSSAHASTESKRTMNRRRSPARWSKMQLICWQIYLQKTDQTSAQCAPEKRVHTILPPCNCTMEHPRKWAGATFPAWNTVKWFELQR